MGIRVLVVINAIVSGVFFTSFAFAQGAAGGGGAKGASSGPLELFMSAAHISMSSSASGMDLAPGALYSPFPSLGWLQVGGEISYNTLSFQGGSTKTMTILAGPVFNLSGATNNDAVFVGIGIANRSGSSDVVDSAADSPAGMGFHFIVGKRFPLSGGWCYRPSLGVVSAGVTGMVFRPLAISLFF